MNCGDPAPKARMEFKTTEQVKSLLIEAASMSGVDLTAFVINAAAERARAVLEEHARIKLDAEAHARFAAALFLPLATARQAVGATAG